MLMVNTKKLVLARAQAALTVRELSKKSGVTTSTINRIEKGHIEPNPVTVGKIARALNVPVETLFLEE